MSDTILSAAEEEWRTQPTDLGGWANRASEMRQLAASLLAERDAAREALRRIADTNDPLLGIGSEAEFAEDFLSSLDDPVNT